MPQELLKKATLLILLLICTTSDTLARDFGDLYSHQKLLAAARRYTINLKGLWREDFLSRLTISERSRAAQIHLNLPLLGLHHSPFEFYSAENRQEVIIPIMSVKFLDDLSTAQAYLERFNCRKDAIFDYIVLLGRKEDFPHIPPLRALGIPSNALDNPYVNKTSGNALKSAVYFIMAHEYAHVMYRHLGYDQITANQAQAQEIEADNFALRVMNRIGVPPLGMVGYFALLSQYDRVPADFNTAQEYGNYLKYTATHPLSSKRLINIADRLRSDPAGFVRSEPNPTQWAGRVLSIAHDIETIGKNLDDPKLREYEIMKAFRQTRSSLARACD